MSVCFSHYFSTNICPVQHRKCYGLDIWFLRSTSADWAQEQRGSGDILWAMPWPVSPASPWNWGGWARPRQTHTGSCFSPTLRCWRGLLSIQVATNCTAFLHHRFISNKQTGCFLLFCTKCTLTCYQGRHHLVGQLQVGQGGWRELLAEGAGWGGWSDFPPYQRLEIWC